MAMHFPEIKKNFGFYLMHAQDANSFRRYKSLGAYETSLELLKEVSKEFDH